MCVSDLEYLQLLLAKGAGLVLSFRSVEFMGSFWRLASGSGLL